MDSLHPGLIAVHFRIQFHHFFPQWRMDAVLPTGIISGHHVIATGQFHQCGKLCDQVVLLAFHAASDRILSP